MKRVFVILAALGLVIGLSVPSSAQSVLLNHTTLSGAISNSQTTLVLASASASTGATVGAPAAGQCLWIDQELMRIVSLSSTTATVTRSRTKPQTHANAADILTGPCANFFSAPPLTGNSGNVACSTEVLPHVDTASGFVYWCDIVNNKWLGYAAWPFTYNSLRWVQ